MHVALPATPFEVDFEILSSCNLRCKYCYAQPFSGETPTEKELEFLFSKTRKEADPFKVTIEGGEPFLRSDILEILSMAKGYFGNVGVVTNGTLLHKLSRSDLHELKRFTDGSPLVQVSLDSSDTCVNDLDRGFGTEVLRGLDTIDGCGITFSVGIVMTNVNMSSIVDTVRTLVSRYMHLKHIHLMNVMPSRGLGNAWLNLHLKPEESLCISSKVKELLNSFDERNLTLSGPYSVKCTIDRTLLDKLELTSCTAGLLRATVLVNGDVIPCEMARERIIGNLFKNSWKEIWAKSLGLYFQSKMEGGLCFNINLIRSASRPRALN
jgi:MoaA/NifB/PqqE/SkfB family radical SAM enzyme